MTEDPSVVGDPVELGSSWQNLGAESGLHSESLSLLARWAGLHLL